MLAVRQSVYWAAFRHLFAKLAHRRDPAPSVMARCTLRNEGPLGPERCPQPVDSPCT
ncbi:hypothetical protein BVI1335_1570014 [Burkholderia vietnamiensis]|nr:hypothetical protein BVI1335_1570014 [Burkholderia vietnamiensis]